MFNIDYVNLIRTLTDLLNKSTNETRRNMFTKKLEYYKMRQKQKMLVTNNGNV